MKNIIKIVCLMVFILGCKDTTDDNINTLIPSGEIPDEVEAVQLIFPFENSLCTEGTDVTPTTSTVIFEWTTNNNAQSYTLTVENLSTSTVSEFQTEGFIFPVTINRADAFRCSVSYVYQNEIYQSEIWNFYNEGEAIQTYAPFQAEIITPTMAEAIVTTNSVNLQWNGSDVDDDIVGYDVYFGSTNPPDLNASDTTTNNLTVSVTLGTIYYWKVETKDAEGNSSETDIFQFQVQN